MSTTADLATTLSQAHARFIAATQGLDTSSIEREPAVGSWSVRDLAAHLAGWVEETLLAVEHALGGDAVPHHPIEDGEGFNQEQAAHGRTESWETVEARLANGVERTAALAGSLSGEQLAAMGSYPWNETGSVADILTSIAAHYDEHSEQLEAWRAERQAVASS